MEQEKKILITKLRDKNRSMMDFRAAATSLALVLAHEVAELIPSKKIDVESPISLAEGVQYAVPIVLVPILRSGLALVPPFLTVFPDASIGVVGVRRDEKTAKPVQYYDNIPPLREDTRLIILDPMLATGGTAVATVGLLTNRGVSEKQIVFAAMISSPEGIDALMTAFPNITLLVAQEDKSLNDKKFIVPGIGDFGDRFFGTV